MELHVRIDRAEALRRGIPTSGDRLTIRPTDEEIAALPSEDRELLAARLQDDGSVAARTPGGEIQRNQRLIVAQPTLAGVLDAIRAEEDAVTIHRRERLERRAAAREAYANACREVIEQRRTMLREHRLPADKGWDRYEVPAPAWPKADAYTDSGAACDGEIRAALIAEIPGAVAWQQELEAQAVAAREAALAVHEAEIAERERQKQEAADERRRWIEEHGSERLRRAATEGIEHGAIYRDERLELERPGWIWLDDVAGDVDEARNPPGEAFAVLDAARKVEPQATLKYYRVIRHYTDAQLDEVADDPDFEPGDVTGYVAEAEFLGRTIVFGPVID